MEESNKNEQLMKEQQQIHNLDNSAAEQLDDRRIQQQAMDQKMAQSCKHENDKLRKEVDELKKNNELEMDKLKAHIAQLEGQLTTTTMELNRFRKRYGAHLEAIDRKREEDRQRAMEARKQLAMEMAIKYNMPSLNVNRDNEDGKSPFRFKRVKIEIPRLLAIRHNMNNNDNNNGNGGNSTTKSDMNVWMPLELHCEWFACLPLFFQRQLIPELCRGIYAIKGKEVKRKLELLNKWQHWDKSRMEVSADRRTVKYIHKNKNKYGEWATVRAARPFCFQSSSQCQMRGHRICYFEVKIVVINKIIQIGLCDGNFPFCSGVGRRANSFGIGWNGRVWMENVNVESNYYWAFRKGDVMGCGLEIGAAVDDGQKMHLFFTRNGTIWGNPFQMPASANGVKLFPAVTLREYGSQIETNFGNLPFMYNLDKHNSAKQH